MSLVVEKRIDKKEAFFTAESFHGAAYSIFPNDWLDNENDDEHWFIPFLVNLAFACEVYIKMLAVDHVERLPNNHEWLSLIKTVPQLFEELNNHPLLVSYESLEQKIRESERTFIHWRYFYEHDYPKCVDIVFLERFAIALHDVVEQCLIK